MSVKVVGYSERGMVNALCYDLLKSEDCRKVEAFLEWFDFSHLDEHERPCFTGIQSAFLLVEQSFSDFGDLDLLVLLEHEPSDDGPHPPAKQAVLIEAKVSWDTNSWQTIRDRFDEFLGMVDGGEGSTSNLFVQLHRKMRLVDRIRNDGEVHVTDLFTVRGSFGANRVVERAKQLLASYVKDGGQAWFAAIVPDGPDDIANFARGLPQKDGSQGVLPLWDSKRLGFSSWKTIHDRTISDGESWPLTKAAFAWNKGQIYREKPPVGHDIQPGGISIYEGRHVFVIPEKIGHICRVALLDGGDPNFFWTTTTVPTANMNACPEPNPGHDRPSRPVVGLSYAWVDRRDGAPPTKEPHPAGMPDETAVEVIKSSWLTTRVRRRAEDPPGSRGFLVYTHHLRRTPVC